MPSYFFARNCEQSELCSRAGGVLENLGEFRDTPVFERWRLDIKTVWDVERMRETLNVMTAKEFNRVMLVKQNIVVEDPEGWISSLGGDLRMPRAFGVVKTYHDLDRRISVDSRPVLDFLFHQQPGVEIMDDLDPLPNKGLLPVRDTKTPQQQPEMKLWVFPERLEMSMNETQERSVPIRWEDARDNNSTTMNGILPLGFKQTYQSNATILHFQEGIHDFGRFPFRFTTEASRDRYLNMVLNELPRSKDILEAGDYVLQRLQTLLGGKPYVGFHYRLTDFIPYNWAKTESTEVMVHKFVYCNWLFRDQSNTTEVCEVDFSTLPRTETPEDNLGEVPWKKMEGCINRRFYFATDETDSGFRDELRRIGGIRIEDLLDEGFVKKYQHLAAFRDYLG